MTVVGLPSTTLGDKSTGEQLDGVMRYGVAGLRADHTWGVAIQDVGPLMPISDARDDASSSRRRDAALALRT